MPTVAGGTAASAWLIGSPLTKGKYSAQPIGAGATVTAADVEVSGENELSVGCEMTGGASGDLAITVIPFKSDGVTPLSNITIPPTYSNGPTFGGGVVQYTATYDVTGYSKVRILVKNNNAGAQTVNELWWQTKPN